MHKLKGDTLIEVTIAVGIFSMVAIAVVSVINGSASGAQVTLESTLAREEIDAQAEALRFIHSSYIADPGNEAYAKTWQAIIDSANEVNSDSAVLTYNPATCDDLYSTSQDDPNTIFNQKAFAVNTRALSSSNAGDIVIKTDSKKFAPAATYPHLIFPDNDDSDEASGALYGNINNVSSNISRIEGIYVVAVKDSSKTTIVPEASSSSIAPKSAYYDFYIRSCWYGPGADRPSTISTVIRLYDPSVKTSQ